MSIISMRLPFLLLFVLITTQIHSLYLQLDPSPFCFTLQPVPDNTYKFQYESFTPQSIIDVVISSQALGMIELSGRSNATAFKSNSETRVCLKNRLKSIEPIAIDFYLQEHQKLKDLALKSDIKVVHEQIIEAAESLSIIAHNARFEQQKQILHTQMIERHEQSISWYGMIKTGLIVGIAACQVWLFSSYLSKGPQKIIPF